MKKISKNGGRDREEVWEKVKAQVRSRFLLKATGDGRGIENALAKSELLSMCSGQSIARGSCQNVTFRPQDVEPLLEQAIIILEKAASDLASAQLLGEKFASLSLELEQFFSLDDILLAEEAAGKYQVDQDVSKNQLASLNAKLSPLNDSLDKLKELLSRLDPKSGVGFDAKERAGGIPYVRAQYSPQAQIEEQVYWEVPDGGSSGHQHTGKKVDVDYDLSRLQSEYEQENQSCSVGSSIESVNAEIAATRSSIAAITAQDNWNKLNVQFLKDRASRIREVMQGKAAFASNGDLLDFGTRMLSVKNRYQAQFADAWIRLKAVEKGLQQLYNYSIIETRKSKLVRRIDLLPVITDDINSFEEVLAWTRRASAWMAAFTRKCHNYILPISIKRITGTKWVQGKKTGNWFFNINKDLFDANERHVRVRGICAWCPDSTNIYTLDITVPKLTSITYESDPSSAVHQYSQDVNTCRIGRVFPRSLGGNPEISGVAALFNASPFGDWQISATNQTTGTNSYPDDFQIDLYLSVLPV